LLHRFTTHCFDGATLHMTHACMTSVTTMVHAQLDN